MVPPKINKIKEANIKDLLPNYHPLAADETGKKSLPLTNSRLIKILLFSIYTAQS
jgi:hypothetical protein